MGNEITKLAPQNVWKHFYEMTQIPRPSKKEEQITAFVADFGKKLGLQAETDKIGNVLIRKPASKGMENRKGVILQGHLDMVMVPQTHTEAIDAYIDGDWVRARGTTLGADNGIGAAAAMAVLESSEIVHPPLEVLMTVDEETGMSGASAIDANWLKGDILINLDSEEVDELCIGCAGGLDGIFTDTYTEVPTQGSAFTLSIDGLKSGHSGNDIHLGRANAIKLIARTLKRLVEKYGVQLVSLKGGEVRNAIPRKAEAVVVVAKNEKEVKDEMAQLQSAIQAEYELVEGSIEITLKPAAQVQKALKSGDALRYLNALMACPTNIVRMSNAIEGLVETSLNLAIIDIADGKFMAHSLLRSSVGSAITYLSETMESVFSLANIKSSFVGGYPGWNPNVNSPILKVMSDLYGKMFGQKPHIRAVHAGLECGLLGSKYPELDMISCGPNIQNPHSTSERVQISSVETWWKFLLEVLKNI